MRPTTARIARQSGGSAGSMAVQTPYQKALSYAECMRSHGVPGFPDPNSQGDFLVNPSDNIDIDELSPQYKSAVKTCAHLFPFRPTPRSNGRL
jgi:hypothetical protein